MFIKNNSYLRLVRVPERHGIFVRGDNVYEVMTSPGVVKTVPAKQLGEALGLAPREPRNDLQECRRTAQRLFREGKHEDWVEYSTAIVVPGESLTAY
ncbi:hypothetical protein KKR91_07985 [Arthrobacter jiangjiafuii]|uniref:Uncharacterized protein n=1 Tax=Arthrobacter jiangjiafuii TaxID=2817475 RepID=A0A975M8N9_9MICC|nr:hypothetical protein [Arthrobacter jiangjiafuii]MBP3042942.1 hypothetical protein [Arthrobacter jiangjiafuii]QWC11471.1 hypothetical protein KKR91_07985 [Arthrobacter jiangjiafuii]